ncbi:MAG: MerR family DNA-binding transcriptional regulator, partial [Oscillospiraceae bacterium]|nr:MerR family DNA-binding transcriptional regulator [Oscillospiraceae bacterium]
MKDGLFSIGEVSKSKGITVKALRFYDEIGLLKPHFIDPESGYRYYHADQMLPIDIIKAA